MIVDGNNFISHYLKNGLPLCAGKIGVTELNLLYCDHTLKNANRFLPHLQHEAEDIAGLYPYSLETTKQFAKDMISALEQIDLIPKWNQVNPYFENYVFENYCKQAKLTLLQHLEPYFFDKPWTDYLEGKTVLVMSPFAESIERNFRNLDKIWSGKIKPNFKLKTIKYPFALKINQQAYERYKVSDNVYKEYLDILRKQDFDVGIFGTGYTSLLLTAECKRMGKAGIHLGGSTQILFGIKGQRWREIKEFQSFFNEHWTDPLESEKPENRKICEGGCYW
jgi:hypothetical protein